MDTEKIFQETQAAVTQRKRYEAVRDKIRSMYLAGIRTPEGETVTAAEQLCPENVFYQYKRRTIPLLAYNAPSVEITSARRGMFKAWAKGLEYVVNDVLVEGRIEETSLRMADNFCECMSVAKVTMEYRCGVLIPIIRPVDLSVVFVDPACSSYEDAKYAGEDLVVDADAILSQAQQSQAQGWNLKALEDILASATTQDTGREETDGLTRREVTVREIWLRNGTLPNMPPFHYGVLVTLHPSTGEILRAPRPYFGPPSGPYDWGGYLPISKTPYFVSPLSAPLSEIVRLNKMTEANDLSVDSYKRFLAVQQRNPDLAEKITAAKNGQVIIVTSLSDGDAEMFESGGSTPQMENAVLQMRERTDRNVGLTTYNRGNVTGEGTATEVRAAEDASSTQDDGVKAAFVRHVTRLVEKVAWYCWHSEAMGNRTLSEEAANELGQIIAQQTGFPEPTPDMVPAFWRGGGDSQTPFEGLDLRISPLSMGRTNQSLQTARAQAAAILVKEMVPTIYQYPIGVDYKLYAKKMGESVNDPELEDIVDVDIVRQDAMQMRQMQAQMAMMQGIGQRPQGKPQ